MSESKSPDALRAMVAGTLANFQHPTLKHNLTTLKALHHVALMDDTLHVELIMPFVWNKPFEDLKSNVVVICSVSLAQRLSTGSCRTILPRLSASKTNQALMALRTLSPSAQARAAWVNPPQR